MNLAVNQHPKIMTQASKDTKQIVVQFLNQLNQMDICYIVLMLYNL